MVKTALSQKQEMSSKKNIVKVNKELLHKHEPFVYILNKENMLSAIAECLGENDIDGIIELVKIYLSTVKQAKKYKTSEEKVSKAKSVYCDDEPCGEMVPQFASSGRSSGGSKKLV